MTTPASNITSLPSTSSYLNTANNSHPANQTKPNTAAANSTKSNSKKPKLKVLQLNINGVRNKITELKQLLTTENIDVAVIQETKLHPSIKTPEIQNYSSSRQDRPGLDPSNPRNNGGGLITYIKNDLPYTKTSSYSLPGIESQTVTIPLTQSKNLIITNLYIPPRNPNVNQQTDDQNVTTLFTHLTNIPNSLIAGDVNADSQLWHSPITDNRGEVIESLLNSSEHTVLNGNTSTRVPNTTNQQPTSPDLTTISSNLTNQATGKLKQHLCPTTYLSSPQSTQNATSDSPIARKH
jgi:hypothetical protein